MIIAVLSNKEQYQSLLDSRLDINKVSILCDNASFYNFLKNKDIKFQPFHEENIKEHWVEINKWACEKSLLWGHFVDKSLFSTSLEFNKALYVYFSYYLTFFLKSYLMAEFLYRKYKPEEIVIFENVYCPQFPLYNGNYFLNLFLHKLYALFGAKVHLLRLSKITYLKNQSSTKERIRIFIQSIYGRLVVIFKKQKVFMVCGSLKHLAPVIKELKRNKKSIFIYDFEFHLEQLIFALKNGAQYCIPQCFRSKKKKGSSSNVYENEFKRAIKILCDNGWFKYKTHDLGNFIYSEVLGHSKQYFNDIHAWKDVYSNIVSSYNINSLIVDEDMSPRRSFMAAFLKSRNIKTFCISHGCGYLNFSLKDIDRIFFLSETFVHSGYEKLSYASRGWDDKHVHVTGIPRYDRLVSFQPKDSHSRKKMRILLCGSTMFDYHPGYVNYMDNYIHILGSYMKKCLDDMMQAINNCNIEIIVKPHNVEDKSLWVDFLKKYSRDISLVSAKVDFLDLLSQSDAMFLGYWSTAITEGIIANVPTVVLDYSGFYNDHPFIQNSLCTLVRNQEQLKDVISSLYSKFIASKPPEYEVDINKSRNFYVGINDGNNTKRVIESIIG